MHDFHKIGPHVILARDEANNNNLGVVNGKIEYISLNTPIWSPSENIYRCRQFTTPM